MTTVVKMELYDQGSLICDGLEVYMQEPVKGGIQSTPDLQA
jgi:hypothetical protein